MGNAASAGVPPLFSNTVKLYDLNQKLWNWKAEGKIDTILVNPFPHFNKKHITWVLGYKNTLLMDEFWSDKSEELLSKMNGPNGFLVYNVLLQQAIAREEDKHDNKLEETNGTHGT